MLLATSSLSRRVLTCFVVCAWLLFLRQYRLSSGGPWSSSDRPVHAADKVAAAPSGSTKSGIPIQKNQLLDSHGDRDENRAAQTPAEARFGKGTEDASLIPWPRFNLGMRRTSRIPEILEHQETSSTSDEARMAFTRKQQQLPAAYRVVDPEDNTSQWCNERFGPQYLYDLRDYRVNYCEADSKSRFTCFHSQTDASGILDQMCIGQDAIYVAKHQRFFMDCEWRNLTDTEWEEGIPMVGEFRNYWFETGPIRVMNQTLATDQEVYARRQDETKNPVKHTILLKREHMIHHIFHTFMQMLSLSMSLDVLRMTRDEQTGRPFLVDEDIMNVRIAILDDHEEGPFYNLWSMFTSQPLIRYRDLTADDLEGQNFIIPLTGGGNPFWHGDWIVHPCEHSELLAAFRRTLLDFHNITEERRDETTPVRVTLIDRKSNRHLLQESQLAGAIRTRFPDVSVSVVDFELLSLKEQISIAQHTDVLVGVHGAGLTHSLFTPTGSALVELSPTRLDFKGFRSLANLAGNEYFAMHVTNNKTLDSNEDWHFNDVEIEQERFLDVVGLAIRTMYNKGFRSKDVDL